MEVGFVTDVRFLPSRPEPLEKIYRRTIESAVLAEELGFAHFWASEHHFAEDAWSPSPLVLLAGVATRTSRIRLGTYVTLLGMHHPLRYAEDAATVDILSDGRLDLGFGGAGMELEYRTLGIDPNGSYSRAYEAAEIIQKCFMEEEFSHKGKFFEFTNVRLMPKPVQKPHPPILWAAMGPKSLMHAAERNYGLASALHAPNWKSYVDKQRELGRSHPKDYYVVSGPILSHLAETREKAWDEAEEPMHWSLEFYNRRGANMPLAALGEFRKPENALAYGVPIPVGTPDQVLKMLSAYRDEPIDELGIGLFHPGMDFEAVKRATRFFAKELLPEIKRWGKTS